MSQSCGSLQFFEGGTIKGASIINSQITDSIISNSTIQSAKLETLTSIDSYSTKVIADAIAALPPDQLAPLVNAIMAAFTTSPQIEPALGTGDGSLPTSVYGDRSSLLGKPQMFGKFGPDYVVPLFRSGV